jgi:hypothetical protein
MKGLEAWLAFEETRRNRRPEESVSDVWPGPALPPPNWGNAKGEGRSISAEDLLGEHGSPSMLPLVFRVSLDGAVGLLHQMVEVTPDPPMRSGVIQTPRRF